MNAVYFFAGWAVGLVFEYVLHVLMHRRSLKFHLHHHHEFFELEPRQVALNDISPKLNIIFLAALLAVFSPLMLLTGVAPVLLAWAGIFWHIIFVYEACHALIHYDALLPRIVKNRSVYRWWRGCHIQHHSHSPTGNFSVTFPVLDWIVGTYVRPSAEVRTVAE
jgi:sterol desaturase/sphingolipid hydroxylase (fatty acid hydroxylase superfamily)